ncbi:MAG: hypothetical protein WA996_25915, partial [Candidatus Promineifilaceae bacterium]
MTGRVIVHSRRLSALFVGITAALLLLAMLGIVATSFAVEVPTAHYTLDIGYLGTTFSGTLKTQPTAANPESKLWWNDGFWWGSLWNITAEEYRIYRLNWGTQAWEDTGVAIDDRP